MKMYFKEDANFKNLINRSKEMFVNKVQFKKLPN